MADGSAAGKFKAAACRLTKSTSIQSLLTAAGAQSKASVGCLSGAQACARMQGTILTTRQPARLQQKGRQVRQEQPAPGAYAHTWQEPAVAAPVA